mmetsp:Transcript_1712/g.5961  ORF Transcript_1712/g.5961 Transcript_1712/m.5961 type:complete len:1611 (-) Transcript_1712:131-4963(-)
MWRFSLEPRRWFAGALWLLALVAAVAGDGTIFSILFTPVDDPNSPTPEEYFTDMQLALSAAAAGAGAGLAAGFGIDSFLAQADFSQDFSSGRMDLIVCELEPFWERGAIVTRLQDCPLSQVKLVVYTLVPAVAMLFGLLGGWSRQRNVRGRGKETQIGGLLTLGLALLSVSYDWFFSWTLFRNPRGDFQAGVSEVGLAHLIAAGALNFLLVHFWFRRKFLVGMPWYEYHKHGVGMHAVFLLMYIQPQSVLVFQSRLFDVDLFNIHFGTPSKMNEVLSNVGCLCLLQDVPQLLLQFAVWVNDGTGMQAPRVSAISMGLSALSIAVVLKRQYIASVERQWYKEIVRMAGVRRLTTYGGASRWLKLQKRPSAAADVKASASTSQQQLFLAWMQSMGRRQESIFQDAAGSKKSLRAPGDGDSEDSEDDLDSLSDSDEDGLQDAAASGRPKSPGRLEDDLAKRNEGSDSGSDFADDVEEDDDGSGSGSSGSEESGSGSEADGPTQLQSYGRRRRRPQQRRQKRQDAVAQEGASTVLSSGLGGIMNFARGVALDGSESGVVSESDILTFAKRVAGHISESGVVTESFEDDGFSSDGGSVTGNALLRYARNIAGADSDAGTSMAGSDVLAFARNIARNTSESGASAATTNGTDIFAFARQVAGQSLDNQSHVSGQSGDIFAFAREAADAMSQSGVGASSAGTTQSDIYAFAQQIAGAASASGVHSGFSAGRPRPRSAGTRSQASSKVSQQSALASIAESDIFAVAQRAAVETSISGVGSQANASQFGSDAGSGASDIFAAARNAAAEVSVSGVGAGSAAASAAGLSGIFVSTRAPKASLPSERSHGSAVEVRSAASEMSDIFGLAQQAAAEVSESGVGGASQDGTVAGLSEIFGSNRRVGQGQRQQLETQSSIGSDIFAAAKHAAADASVSGVGSASRSGIESDIFAAAQQAAAEASRSGVGSGSVARSSASAGGIAGLFAPAQRVQGSARSAQASSRAARNNNLHAHAHSDVQSAVSSGGGMDLFASAQRAANDVQSHVSSASNARSARSGGGQSEAESDFDFFALARGAAEDVSRSGVPSSKSHASRSLAGLDDIFANFQRPPAGADDASGVGSEFDILGSARRAADDASGVQSSVESDIFAVARQAAADAQSGVGSGVESDIFSAARRAAAELSTSGVGEGSDVGSDIFGSALNAAGGVSESGVGSQSAVGSALPSGLFAARGAPKAAPRNADFEFAPQRRRFASDGRHSSAPPLVLSSVQSRATSTPDENFDLDQPPWAVLSLLGLPPPPPPPRYIPPSPPGAAPPLPAEQGFAFAANLTGTGHERADQAITGTRSITMSVSSGAGAKRASEAPVGQVLQFAREVAAETNRNVHTEVPAVPSSKLGAPDGSRNKSRSIEGRRSEGALDDIFFQRGVPRQIGEAQVRHEASPSARTPLGSAPQSSDAAGSAFTRQNKLERLASFADSDPNSYLAKDVSHATTKMPLAMASIAESRSPSQGVRPGILSGTVSAHAKLSESAACVPSNSAPQSLAVAQQPAAPSQLRSQRFETRRRMQDSDSRDYKRKHARNTPESSTDAPARGSQQDGLSASSGQPQPSGSPRDPARVPPSDSGK